MSAYQAVVISAAREWTCKHKHRTEVAAFDCACREVRHRINRLLHGDPHAETPSHFAQWSAFTREVTR